MLSRAALLWLLLSQIWEAIGKSHCSSDGSCSDAEEGADTKAQEFLLLQVEQSKLTKERRAQPQYVRAYIQRHSEAVGNVNDCDDLPWPDTGLTQRGVDLAFEAHGFVLSRGERPTISFASALQRAQQTAAITFNQTFYVADYIPEVGFTAEPQCENQWVGGKYTYLENCANRPEVQEENMLFGRGSQSDASRYWCPDAVPTPEAVPLRNFSLLAGLDLYSDLHKSNWTSFTEWMWQAPEVKDIVADVLQGEDRLISVTTHSEFMEQLMPEKDPLKPDYGSIYEVQLPLEYDENGEVIGFQMVPPRNWNCIWKCQGTAE